jgi:hypothetical protein
MRLAAPVKATVGSIEIELMARSLSAGFGRSAFETIRALPAHPGKMLMVNG